MDTNYMEMHRISTKEAATELGIGVDTLQFLMQQNRLPIGFVTLRPKSVRRTYFIFRESLDSFKNSLSNGDLIAYLSENK